MKAPEGCKQVDAKPLKKKYVAPALTEYGSVSKLTESGARSVRSDHGSNAMYT